MSNKKLFLLELVELDADRQNLASGVTAIVANNQKEVEKILLDFVQDRFYSVESIFLGRRFADFKEFCEERADFIILHEFELNSQYKVSQLVYSHLRSYYGSTKPVPIK